MLATKRHMRHLRVGEAVACALVDHRSTNDVIVIDQVKYISLQFTNDANWPRACMRERERDS